jgi:nitroimidazol reductase NimA-like FMN-containing flavoprotein (pyridoxamine 5'-phosphate oxidase superfamily)
MDEREATVTEEQARSRLVELFAGQYLGVLATGGGDQIHATLVAFVATDDLERVLFATARATRKFELICRNPQVALLVDDRTNDVRDFKDAIAVTVRGVAREVPVEQRAHSVALYLDRHPYLADFVRAPSCALLAIDVETYDIVSHFQDVVQLRVGRG